MGRSSVTGTGRPNETPRSPDESAAVVAARAGGCAITGLHAVSWAEASDADTPRTTPTPTVHEKRIVLPSIAREVNLPRKRGGPGGLLPSASFDPFAVPDAGETLGDRNWRIRSLGTVRKLGKFVEADAEEDKGGGLNQNKREFVHPSFFLLLSAMFLLHPSSFSPKQRRR
jgi:hypothetical protein